jgi:hypothetical protein
VCVGGDGGGEGQGKRRFPVRPRYQEQRDSMLQRARQEINALEDTSGDDGGSPRHRQRGMGRMGLVQSPGVAPPPAPAYGPRHRVQHMHPVPGAAGRVAGPCQGGHSCCQGCRVVGAVIGDHENVTQEARK